MISNAWQVTADSHQSYQVAVSEPLLHPDNKDLISAGRTPGRRLVFLDSGLPESWPDQFRAYFCAHSITPTIRIVPGGERCKTLDTVRLLLEEMHSFDVDRRLEPVIVVGGGALLDAAGFAASIYRRGVPFIRVPTTLLAYVDASVGIKTGVNFGSGKNLVGAFSAPKLVLLDRRFFASLPPAEIASGMGEVLKLALGCDPDLFTLLENFVHRDQDSSFESAIGTEILHRSISVMLKQLDDNFYEQDLCRAVDLGHTFSQAFELHAQPGLRHGEAVALDLNLSAILSAQRGLLSDAELDRLVALTIALGLPTTVPEVDPELIWGSLVERTQHRAGWQRTPIPERIGQCIFVDDLSKSEVVDAFKKLKTEHFPYSGYAENTTKGPIRWPSLNL